MLPLALLLAALAQQGGVNQAAAPADPDAQSCATMRKYEEEQRPRWGEMVDSVTRLESFTVDCANRLLTWRKTLVGDPANLREGWQARKQAEWSGLVCNSPRFRAMVERRWRFVERNDLGGGREEAFEARCG